MNIFIKTISVCAVCISSLCASTYNSALTRILNNAYQNGQVSDKYKENADKDIDIKTLPNKDKFVLRLGSYPSLREWHGNKNDADNSYLEWKNGLYGPTLRALGIPMRNIVHCCLFEFYGESEMDYRDKDFDVLAAKGGYATRLATDFNTENIIDGSDFVMYMMNDDSSGDLEPQKNVISSTNEQEIEHKDELNTKDVIADGKETQTSKEEPSTGFFDYIISDNRTTKFIKNADGVYNILSTLKFGGKAIFTDLNEDKTYHMELMYNRSMHAFEPMKKSEFNIKDKYEIAEVKDSKDIDTSYNVSNYDASLGIPKWRNGNLALLELLFEDHNGKIVTFKNLKTKETLKLKIEFYNRLSDIVKEKANLVEDFAKYLLLLGNISFFNNENSLLYEDSYYGSTVYGSRQSELEHNKFVVITRLKD